MAENEGITIKKNQDMPEWYSQVCIKSGLADYGPVKGTMVIRPYGYSIWQSIQDYFNSVLKNKKISNAYFPLFIPESFFKKEAKHAQGFKAEVAWIESKEEGEKIALRPTSETVMYDSYSKWIRSYRDLPLRINQWCNIVRWEVSDCKLFLRSREFLWQEGHCVYETEKECDKEVLMILDEYEKLCHNLLAIPVLKGMKTEKEKFAGAKYTYAIESFMPDGKALQCGTSHNLGQNFAKSFNIKYLDRNEKSQYPWQSSWGVSTRLIGALVMTHSDDKGLILPPSIAPIQIVIVPIFKPETKNKIIREAEKVKESLKNFRIELDSREEYTPGYKFNDWEMKGVPIRIEIGPRDIEASQVTIARRDTGEKTQIKIKDIEKTIPKIIQEIQSNLFEKAKIFLDSSIKKPKDWKEFRKIINERKLVLAPFCGNPECEEEIKSETSGAGSRVIKEEISKQKCIHCGKPARFLVYFARSY